MALRLGRSEAITRTSSLLDLCCISLAKRVSERSSHVIGCLPHLPTELLERLLESLSAQNLLTNETLLDVSSPNLKVLSVGNLKYRASHPDREAIRTSISICTSLDTLKCHGCLLDDSVLEVLCQDPFKSQLRILDLSSCYGITSNGIKQVIQNCTRLEDLDLSGCPITDDVFDILTSFAPTLTFDGLEKVSMKRTREDSEYLNNTSTGFLPQEETEDETLEQPAKRFCGNEMVKDASNLACYAFNSEDVPHVWMRSLNISGCCSITNRSLQLISKLFPYLIHFNCSHIESNDNLNIRPILQNCRFLKSININGCKIDQSKPLVCHNSMLLEEISFCGTGTLNNNFYDLLVNCVKQLRILRLRNKSFFLDPEEYTDPTEWLRHSTVLSTLDLYSVSVGDSLLSHILHSPSRDTLEVLDVTHCRISDSELKLFSDTFFPRLRSLSLNHVAIVEWMPTLGSNCPNLTHLCMNLCLKSLLPESAVSRLLSGFRNLLDLELWCCKSLSLPTVLVILEMCPKLQGILLSTANSEDIEPVDMKSDSVDDDDDDSDSEDDRNIENFQPSFNDHQLHDHHGSHQKSGILSNEEFSLLTKDYPHVRFKIWHHTISGNRHFCYHSGGTWHDEVGALMIPTPVNRLSVKLKVQTQDGASEIVPTILVDNIPIWSHETSASLLHLRQTTDGSDGGALPLISGWCCECNIESYNGVLFYHDSDHVFWETHEPGIQQRFRFSKGQYTDAINNARLRYMQLGWQQQRLQLLQQ